MKNRSTYIFLLPILLLTGCYIPYADQQDYWYIQLDEDQMEIIRSYPDTLRFLSSDSILYILPFVDSETSVDRDYEQYPAYTESYDFESYTSTYSSTDFEVEIGLRMDGRPFAGWFAFHNWVFRFPDNESYSLSAPPYTDTTIVLDCQMTDSAGNRIEAGLLTIRDCRILSFEDKDGRRFDAVYAE